MRLIFRKMHKFHRSLYLRVHMRESPHLQQTTLVFDKVLHRSENHKYNKFS